MTKFAPVLIAKTILGNRASIYQKYLCNLICNSIKTRAYNFYWKQKNPKYLRVIDFYTLELTRWPIWYCIDWPRICKLHRTAKSYFLIIYLIFNQFLCHLSAWNLISNIYARYFVLECALKTYYHLHKIWSSLFFYPSLWFFFICPTQWIPQNWFTFQ